jgi:hypothetical protein
MAVFGPGWDAARLRPRRRAAGRINRLRDNRADHDDRVATPLPRAELARLAELAGHRLVAARREHSGHDHEVRELTTAAGTTLLARAGDGAIPLDQEAWFLARARAARVPVPGCAGSARLPPCRPLTSPNSRVC